MELMDATWRPLFLLYNNGSCFLSLSADEDKTYFNLSVSTQFRASPFERALFSALNRVLLIN